jgi:hypothetical protein
MQNIVKAKIVMMLQRLLNIIPMKINMVKSLIVLQSHIISIQRNITALLSHPMRNQKNIINQNMVIP